MIGLLYFFQHPEIPLTTVPQLPVTQVQNVTLLAVPLFIFAGNLMNASGITEKLIQLAMALTGHMFFPLLWAAFPVLQMQMLLWKPVFLVPT